jgi:hypothetical protein
MDMVALRFCSSYWAVAGWNWRWRISRRRRPMMIPVFITAAMSIVAVAGPARSSARLPRWRERSQNETSVTSTY